MLRQGCRLQGPRGELLGGGSHSQQLKVGTAGLGGRDSALQIQCAVTWARVVTRQPRCLRSLYIYPTEQCFSNFLTL